MGQERRSLRVSSLLLLWYADRCGTQTEDINHGQIDIDFAALAFRDGVVFRGRDMERFARTFTRNIMATTDSGVPTV